MILIISKAELRKARHLLPHFQSLFLHVYCEALEGEEGDLFKECPRSPLLEC